MEGSILLSEEAVLVVQTIMEKVASLQQALFKAVYHLMNMPAGDEEKWIVAQNNGQFFFIPKQDAAPLPDKE